MQHFTRICKHCNKEYTYCTYGNGPEFGTEEGCSMDYCGECQTAINNALNKIPIKFDYKFIEIDEPRLFPVLYEIKKNFEESKENIFNVISYSYTDNGYDNIEEYTHMGKKYRIEWNDKTPNEKHILVEMVYNLETKEYIKPREAENKDTYNYKKSLRNLFKKVTSELIKPKPLDKPNGKLFFGSLPLEWDVVSINWDKGYSFFDKPKQKEHILKTYEWSTTGSDIKQSLKNNKIKIADDIDVLKLVDFIDYKCIVQQYDDEDIKHVTEIFCE